MTHPLIRSIAILLFAAMLSTCAVAMSCNQSLAFGPLVPAGRILFDRGEELWVMDGDGKNQHRVLTNADWSALNPDGVHILYWDGRSVRLLSLEDGCDTLVDNTLESTPLDIGWSGDGKTLGYVEHSPRGGGLHVLPFPMGNAVPKVFEHVNHVALSHRGQYALTVSEGLMRVNLLTDERTALQSNMKSVAPWGATYLGAGDMVVELDTVIEKGNDDPDTPGCRGANTALRIIAASSTIPIPFPKGFTSTLQYEFDLSPDGSQLAVSFGADRCDYPGDVAAVYLFSMRDHTLTRVTPKDTRAGRVKFSPDGKALIYTDFKGTGTTAIYRYDISTKQLQPLTAPREQDYDSVIDWR